MQQVTEELEKILDTAQHIDVPTAENIESLTSWVKALTSDMELSWVFDTLSATLKDPLGSVRQWKRQNPTKKAIAFFPIYAPVEIVHAAGMLPVGMVTAPQNLELSGTGLDGSAVCSMVRKAREMARRNQLDVFDGFLFSSLCDSTHDLYSAFKGMFPTLPVDSINLPHESDLSAGTQLLSAELRQWIAGFERSYGKTISDEALRKSISLYNLERSLLRRVYALRTELPYLLDAWECSVIANIGNVIPVEEYSAFLQLVLSKAKERRHRPRQSLRVVVDGTMCEQPSPEVMRILENAGCAIVEDDFAAAHRCFRDDIPATDDPVDGIAEGYLRSKVLGTRRGSPGPRWAAVAEKVHRTNAEAVALLTTNACPAAFLDYLLFKRELEALGTPLLLLSRSASGRISLVQEQEFMRSVQSASIPSQSAECLAKGRIDHSAVGP
jgi:benzoyl-CoA reductase subunit C